MDYNTQRRVIKGISSFAERNKLLLIPCLIATGIVTLCFKTARFIDMTFSDSEGNFLGVKARHNKPDLKRKIIARESIVKRPFALRLISGVLASIFAVTFIPEIPAFAAFVQYGTTTFFYDDTQTAPAAPGIDNANCIVGYNAVKVAWNAVAGADGYEVYIGNSTTPYLSNITALNCYVYGLTPNISTDIKVKSYKKFDLFTDNTGTTPAGSQYTLLSAAATYTCTPGAILSSPVVKSIALTNGSNVTLKWTKVTGAQGYVVYRRDGDLASANYAKVKAIQDNGTDFIYDADGYATFYDQSALPKYGTKYEYVIVAYKDVFNLHGSVYLDNSSTIISDYVLSARAPDLCSADAYGFVVTDPGKPLSLKTIANKSSIKVSWSAPVNSGVDGYYIYRYDTEIEDSAIGTIEGDAAHRLAYVGSSETSYTDTAVADGKQYFYYISSYRKVGPDSFEGTASKVTGTLNVAKNIPQAIFATAGDGKVDISWEGQATNDGYELSITKISNYNGSTTGVGTARTVDLTSTAYTHGNLYNGDVYEYKARSYIIVDGIKVYSAYSESVRATVGIALTTPQDLDATASDGQIDISWSKVTGATGYTLYASKNGEAAIEIDRTETKYSHKKLNNGQVWSYYVKAYKIVNSVKVYSPASMTVTATVGSSITIPQDLKAVSSDGQIDLTWSKVTDATGYILYASKNGGPSQEFDLSNNKFSHTGLTNGEKWTYYVKAYKDVNGVRVFSTASITVTSTAGVYLEAPKDLAATSTSGQVTLTWTKITGATGYKVYLVSGGSYTEVADVSKSTYTITGLTDGAYYSYTVAGYKIVNGEKAYGDMAKPVSIKCGEYLSAPTDVAVKPGNSELTVSWKKVTGAEGYVLYLYNSSTKSFEAVTVITTTTYTHTGLKNGKSYTYMVSAFRTVNGIKEYSDYSMSVTGTPSDDKNKSGSGKTLAVTGTTPAGISHNDLISATAQYDAFEGSVEVHVTTNPDATQRVNACLRSYAGGLNSFAVFPFDLSVYTEGTRDKVQPIEGYTVTMVIPVPDKFIPYKDYVSVIHISDDDSLEVLPSALIQVEDIWCMKFICTSLSPYAFVIYKDNIEEIGSTMGLTADGSNLGGVPAAPFVFTGTALPAVMPDKKKLRIKGSRKLYRVKPFTNGSSFRTV